MKSIQILIASIILFFSAKGQDYTDLGTYKAPKNLSQAHDISINSDQIVLSYSPYLNSLGVKFSFYKYASLNSGVAFTDKIIRSEEGVIWECYYSGDTITEYVFYRTNGFSNSEYTFAFRKRSGRTMEILGEEKTLATHSFYNGLPSEFMRIRLLKMPEGFAFVEFIKDVCTITYLSKDFEEINKVVVSDKKISDVSCKGCYDLKSHDDGSITFFFPENDGTINILHLSENDEQKWFSPLDVGKKNVWGLISDFGYDSKKKELSWVFFAKSASDDQNGYGIVKWNEDGQIISNEVKMLREEEIYLNDKDAKTYLSEKKKTTSQVWDQARVLSPNIKLLNIANDNYMIIHLSGAYNLFSVCYVLKLDKSGGYEWIKPIVTDIGSIWSVIPYENDGKLNLFLTDFTANTKNDAHFVNSSRKADKSYSFYNMVIDPVDGTEVSNKKYNADTGSESQIINVQLSKEDGVALVELLKGKQVIYRQIKL